MQLHKSLFLLLVAVMTLFCPKNAFCQKLVDDIRNPYDDEGYNYVTDTYGILSEETISEVNRISKTMEDDGSLQFGIAIIDYIDSNSTIFDFGVELYNKWGLGVDDKGLLLLVAVDSRKWQFITGYGAEGILPDALLKRIGECYIVPHFKKGDYEKGILEVTKELCTIITSEKSIEEIQTMLDENEKKRIETSDIDNRITQYWFFSILFLLFAWILPKVSTNKKTKKDKIVTTEKGVSVDISEKEWDIWNGRNSLKMLVLQLPIIFVPLSVQFGAPMSDFSIIMIYLGYRCIIKQIAIEISTNHTPQEEACTKYRKYIFLNKKIFLKVIICPIVFLPYLLYYSSRKKSLKKVNTECPICKSRVAFIEAKNLDEEIKAKVKKETELKSMNREYFICENGHIIEVKSKGSKFGHYLVCKKCKSRTVKEIKSKTIKAATYASPGTKEVTYKCENCGGIFVQNKSITKLKESTHSSSGSGGSRSSSGGQRSSGGGRTGGGGAGGSW